MGYRRIAREFLHRELRQQWPNKDTATIVYVNMIAQPCALVKRRKKTADRNIRKDRRFAAAFDASPLAVGNIASFGAAACRPDTGFLSNYYLPVLGKTCGFPPIFSCISGGFPAFRFHLWNMVNYIEPYFRTQRTAEEHVFHALFTRM